MEFAVVTRGWRTVLFVGQPDTVGRWHRLWFRRRWTLRSPHTRPGRPGTAAAIRALVVKMGAANPLWGAPRIHRELRKLGIDSRSGRSPGSCGNGAVRRPRPGGPSSRITVVSVVSVDFFTVPTLSGRVLFVLVLLAHHRRRIVHFMITEHPTAAWTAQQLIEAFPDDTAPGRPLRDRDAMYGDVFRRRVAGMAIAEVVSSP